ncbi:DUF4269 domain-containing protein [Aeromonas hydrophila]|uniref:DUF4269 domain-containing protein n=1 Tax=Aeromonas hydrophila TaxID=644 RepID=UPI0004D8CB13|nr:DUF4269 domain-containing protein [Aeromonas hydrophila]EJN6953492.1 DUF4269 domain-containing protein [Aeromonas hydrophila]KER62242.1 diadenosine tetraphosphate hydrolase [Aeromonas hydrophila]MCX4042157.1 DUF4269 domain-containing protein [Aeromonas hydrophila]OCA59419.1 diadenosine tetraphosphate hydrolase [Aeromonas hydrophila]OCY09751.1 diadenosine tetraphosphate hydrolase [Aeromonas hydrophila]
MPSDLCLLRDELTAAPAAVFPSAKAGPVDWRRLDYLAHGNPRQRSAHALLTAGVWDELAAQCSDLALVSTVAIGLDRPGSDLDIVCQYPEPATFAATLAAQGWRVAQKGADIWLAEQTVTGVDGHPWPLELYLTPDPLERLNGWRHLSLMAALLEQFGAAFYHQVLRLRREEGLKGEAAMCHLLGLAGDPYAALLTLEGGELAPLAWQPRAMGPHFTANSNTNTSSTSSHLNRAQRTFS